MIPSCHPWVIASFRIYHYKDAKYMRLPFITRVLQFWTVLPERAAKTVLQVQMAIDLVWQPWCKKTCTHRRNTNKLPGLATAVLGHEYK